jgi:hypothetical protein
MNKLIDILKRCETILVAAKAPESDLRELQMLIAVVESLSGTSLRSFYEHLYRLGERDKHAPKTKVQKPPQKRISTSVDGVANLYKEQSQNATLSKHDEEILTEIDSIYPRLRDLLLGDITTLYDRISGVKDEEWTTEELQIILYYHFGTKPKQKTTRATLLSELRKEVYNANYMKSMKQKYEEKKDVGKTTD